MGPSWDLKILDDENLFKPLLPSLRDVVWDFVVPSQSGDFPNLLKDDLGPHGEWRDQSMWVVDGRCCTSDLSFRPLSLFYSSRSRTVGPFADGFESAVVAQKILVKAGVVAHSENLVLFDVKLLFWADGDLFGQKIGIQSPENER